MCKDPDAGGRSRPACRTVTSDRRVLSQVSPDET